MPVPILGQHATPEIDAVIVILRCGCGFPGALTVMEGLKIHCPGCSYTYWIQGKSQVPMLMQPPGHEEGRPS
jgi:hypothetical protein